MIASNWRRGRVTSTSSLEGFFDLLLSSGMRIHDCSLHRFGDRRWVGLPGKAQIGKDNKALTSPKTGRPAYSCVVDIPDRERRELFQQRAIEAVDRLIGRGARHERPQRTRNLRRNATLG